MTTEESKKRLIDFLSDVEPKYVTPYLVVKDAISPEDEIYILFNNSSACLNETRAKLVEVLIGKSLRSLTIFFEHLYEHYPWLTKQVKCDYLEEELRYKLEVGYIPLIQACEIDRPSIVGDIQDSLIVAALREPKPQYIIVHGMVGSGKSVIVSQAIRQFQYLELYFPDGVFFLKIGQVLEENAILLKLQYLCKYFEDKYHPETKEAAIQFLKRKTKQFRKFLLILDDVWEQSVLQDLTIGWTILVTTRDKSKLTFNRRLVQMIDMPKGFTWDESMNCISQRVYANPSDLNICASKLHQQYRGLPIMINIIGTAMEEHGNDDNERWVDVYNTLSKENAGRTRRLSGQEDLTEALRMMVGSLNDELKECFKDFLLFWDDYYIPCQVFEVLWDKDHFDVENIMDDLAKKSLVQKMKEEDSKHKCYAIHDLYLKFLKNEFDSVKKERHKKLVNKYLDKCRNKDDDTLDLSLLPQDNYIHIFLAYHLIRAEMFNYFPIIFFDLKFLINKVKITGPHDLLHDLVSYSNHYEGYEDTLNDFLHFIKLNGHILCNADVDVVQLALNEPPSSCIYQQARKLIERSNEPLNIIPSNPVLPSQLYFEYCNRTNNFDSMLLSKRPHESSVSWVVFSPCNRIIASCGDDNLVKVWDSNSGKNLHQFVGHTDSVTCCNFSKDGRYLASSSRDGTVRIWTLDLLKDIIEECSSPATPNRPRSDQFIFSESTIVDENCARVFSNHEGCVLTCTFSHDDKMIASGSEDGTVLVWDPYTGDIIYQLRYHETLAQINHCCFSPSSKYIATCASDSYVVIWNTDTGKQYKKLFHKDKSVEFCRFSSNGKTLISASGQYVWKWDLQNDEPVYQYNNMKTEFYVKCCAFSLDENYIIGGTSARAVVVWTAANGNIYASYKYHSAQVVCVNIANDGSKLVSASEDGTVMIFDMNVLKQQNSMSLVSLTPEFSVRFKNDEPVVATIDECNKIRVYQGFQGTKIFYSLEPEEDLITSCCLSPDCTKLLFGTNLGMVYILYLKTKIKIPYNIHSSQITYCQFLDEGKKFITASMYGLIVFHELLNERDESVNFKPMVMHREPIVKCVSYETKEGSRLLSCSRDGLLIAWDLQKSEVLCKMEHKDTVTSCDVSQDKKFFASASVDKDAIIWNASDGKLLHKFSFEHCVRCCKFSPNGDYLAAGDDDGIIRVFNLLKPSKKYQEFKGHIGFVFDLSWSPCSDRLVSVADEICWWDIRDEKLLQKFLVKGNSIKRIYASKDFKVFVTIDANGILYILKQIDN